MATAQEKTLAALNDAIQMEIDGKKFYLEAGQASADSLGRELFTSLAAEEDEHRQKFEEIYQALRSKNEWPPVTYHPDSGRRLKTVFARASQAAPAGRTPAATELEAVQTAMEMENKTYDYYIRQSRAARHPPEKEFFRAVAAQERVHHTALKDYFQYLQNPAAWFVEKEHPSLDGG